MKKLMSLVVMLMILTTMSNFAATPVLISEPIAEGDLSFIEYENKIISGNFIKYVNNTLHIQLETFENETTVFDLNGKFKSIINTYSKNEDIIIYVESGEATFILLDFLSKDTNKFNGQIKSIAKEQYSILSGDIVEEYEILNTEKGFVEDQFVNAYVSDQGVYLMPTIDTSNKHFNSFGELIEKNITINGEILDKNTTTVNDNLMVPLRDTLESLDYEVIWNNDTRSVEIMKLNQWTSIRIDNNSYFKNKMAHQPLSHAPIIINGSTYVPVEFFNAILDLGLSVDSGNLTITENQMTTHRGYIQAIDYNADGKVSITLSSKKMFDSINDLIIIHASTDTTYFNSPLDQGKLIHVITPPIMTMSLPGQTSAVVIY